VLKNLSGKGKNKKKRGSGLKSTRLHPIRLHPNPQLGQRGVSEIHQDIVNHFRHASPSYPDLSESLSLVLGDLWSHARPLEPIETVCEAQIGHRKEGRNSVVVEDYPNIVLDLR